ncbi:MAG: retropepsin-like domain-containing protein [Deltaproteobacteria bacterium]|nr:retropepsin-like domain-containing protein [Deltaproteobacteria bacterium]
MKRRCLTLLALAMALNLLYCASHTPLLSPEDSFEPGTALLWGNLHFDLSQMGDNQPRKIQFTFEHYETRNKINIVKSLRDNNPLVVFALAPGTYFLTDTRFVTYTQDARITHTVDWRQKKLQYLLKSNQISYFGRLNFSVEKDPKGKMVTMDFSNHFSEDHEVYQRYYGHNRLFAGQHIDAVTGQKMNLFSQAAAKQLSKKTFYVPFEERHNTIVVTPIINGKYPVEMLLDTGCNVTLFAPHAAEAIGLQPTPGIPTQQATIADGSIMETQISRIQSLTMGGLKINNLSAHICKKCNRKNAVNYLCTDYLNHCHYQIDPKNKVLVLTIPE